MTLEVQSDGRIFVVKDCPEKPQFDFPAIPDNSDYEIADERTQEYESALASCERILCADQVWAAAAIALQGDSEYIKSNRNGLDVGLRTGLYQLPNVEWEMGSKCERWCSDCEAFDWSTCRKRQVAILKDQKEESQEELWDEAQLRVKDNLGTYSNDLVCDLARWAIEALKPYYNLTRKP